MASGMNIQDYFLEIENDLTTVTWGHAVNSKQLLQEAIHENLMMLEADVELGILEGGSGYLVPVIVHPPATTSDFSLKEFIAEVITATKNGHCCGIKLDFQSLEVLQSSLDELKHQNDEITFPVMLNAEVLPGPLNSTKKYIDADHFLHSCIERFPECTISVGWTTRYEDLAQNAAYSGEHVLEMEKVVKKNNITQPVTFSVRAGIAAKSPNTLRYLKDNVINSTFTIWSLETDPVDVDRLQDLILEDLGKERVYLDIPKSLMSQLQLFSSKMDSSRAASSDSSPSDK